nr:hypothetical protein CFP56_22212 [Quercus suber]
MHEGCLPRDTTQSGKMATRATPVLRRYPCARVDEYLKNGRIPAPLVRLNIAVWRKRSSPVTFGDIQETDDSQSHACDGMLRWGSHEREYRNKRLLKAWKRK